MSDKLKVENGLGRATLRGAVMHRVPLKHINAMAHHKRTGWLSAVLKAGKINHLALPEPVLEIPFATWVTLLDEYGPRLRGGRIRGLGDVIHWLIKLFFALPIARRFKPKCFDVRGQLKPNSKCAKRQAALNKLL